MSGQLYFIDYIYISCTSHSPLLISLCPFNGFYVPNQHAQTQRDHLLSPMS